MKLTKLVAEITGEQYTLSLHRNGQHVIAEIDGRRYEIDVQTPEEDCYLLVADHQVYECLIDDRSCAALPPDGVAHVHLRNQVYSVAISDPKRLGGGSGADSTRTSTAAATELAAPMPGKIVRLIIEAGAHVEVGDGLLVIEAMKMQNEMKAPRAGTIVELRAQAGATVNAGEVLLIIE